MNCRFRFNDVIVDVMASDASILGYANRWYVEGLAQAIPFELPGGRVIRIFKPDYFLATKLEAFSGRGEGDPYHKDVEDIIILLDGRPELLADVSEASDELRQYIAAGISALAKLGGIDYAIESSGSVRANPGRAKLIHQRMKDLSSLV